MDPDVLERRKEARQRKVGYQMLINEVLAGARQLIAIAVFDLPEAETLTEPQVGLKRSTWMVGETERRAAHPAHPPELFVRRPFLSARAPLVTPPSSTEAS